MRLTKEYNSMNDCHFLATVLASTGKAIEHSQYGIFVSLTPEEWAMERHADYPYLKELGV